MSINVGKLYRKRTVMSLSGEIIDWSDNSPGGGGVIVKKGEIENQQKLDEFIQKEKDKELAAVAEAHEKKDNPPEVIAQRAMNPSEAGMIPNSPTSKKIEDLEKKVEGMEDTLGKILKAVSKQ